MTDCIISQLFLRHPSMTILITQSLTKHPCYFHVATINELGWPWLRQFPPGFRMGADLLHIAVLWAQAEEIMTALDRGNVLYLLKPSAEMSTSAFLLMFFRTEQTTLPTQTPRDRGSRFQSMTSQVVTIRHKINPDFTHLGLASTIKSRLVLHHTLPHTHPRPKTEDCNLSGICVSAPCSPAPCLFSCSS